MKVLIAFLVLASTAFACIGSPYGIDISFSGGVDVQTLKYLHSIDTAIIGEDTVVYRAQYDNRLAVRVDESGISMQIPLTAEQEPAFEFNDWAFAVREELEWLRMNGVVSLTEDVIYEVMSISHPGAIIGVFDGGAGQVASAAYARAADCGDPPILEAAMPPWQLTEDNIMVYVVIIVVAFFAGAIIIFTRR